LHSTPHFSFRLRFAVAAVTLLSLAVGIAHAKPPPKPKRKVQLVNSSGQPINAYVSFRICYRGGNAAGSSAQNGSLASGSLITASKRSKHTICSIEVHMTGPAGTQDYFQTNFGSGSPGQYSARTREGGMVDMQLAKSGGNWTVTIKRCVWG
jgi:hypothetical protein